MTLDDDLPAPCTVSIACDGWGTPRHDIVIETDWSVTTPHDLDADRVAVALGGAEHSCLALGSEVARARSAYTAVSRRPRANLSSPLTDHAFDDRFAAEPKRSRAALDMLCALIQQFRAGSAAPFADAIDDDPHTLPPMGTLSDCVVVPGILSELLRAPEFLALCDAVAASPLPDHAPDSSIPGYSRWLPDADSIDPSAAGQAGATDSPFFQAGNRFGQARIVDGQRAITIRRWGQMFTVPIDRDVERSVPADTDDPRFQLSSTMLDAVTRSEAAGARPHRSTRLARELHHAGEYLEAITWLIYARPHQKPPWPVRITLALFGLALREQFPPWDRVDIIRIVSRHLVLAAPDLYGLPREFTNRSYVTTGPVTVDVDLDELAERTRSWLRRILVTSAPRDQLAALLRAVRVQRRPHDLVCTWGPESVTFQYQRVGHETPIWGAGGDPSARSHLIRAAYLLAFSDVTGLPTILPPVDGDPARRTGRPDYLRQVFDVDALKRLTSVPYPRWS